MRTPFALLLASWSVGLLPSHASAQTPTPAARRAVLVTGASSGIGRATTELLARKGYFVYAGARKDEDLAALDALEHVQAIRLDVTVPDQIEAAVRRVREADRGLYALINNAGVVVIGPLIELREEDLLFQLEVNVLGPFRVTQAFAPLLIESRGRVLTTGSISGTVNWPMGGGARGNPRAERAFRMRCAARHAGRRERRSSRAATPSPRRASRRNAT